MLVKTIMSTWVVEEGHRLDCGPFVKGNMEARKILEHLDCRKDALVNLTKGGLNGIYHVGQEKIMWASDTKHGMPFLRSADVLHSDLSARLLISRKQVANNPLFICPEGSTLITRSGAIGRMVYARRYHANAAISQDVLKVVPDTDKILSGYLYAFLTSKFGVPIVTGGTFGSVITHIEAINIADIPIPRLGKIEEEANRCVQKSSTLLDIYQTKLNESTKLFLSGVDLEDITAFEWHAMGSDLGFTAQVSVKSLRALNFNPRFKQLCERIKNKPWKSLSDICLEGTLKGGLRFKRIDADPEFSYLLIGQKQIFWLRPEGRWISKKSVGDEVLVPNGTILVAGQGTLGESELFCRSEFITGYLLQRAYSQHFLRVISNEEIMPRGALYAFMRSEMAFRMLRSASTGSKLQDFHYAILPIIPVPLPPEEIQDRCNQLVVEAYEAREKAIELEDEARTLVERAIEEGNR